MEEIKKLYQYKPLNKFTIVNLFNEEIRMNSPTCFNDPYDCRIFLENYELPKVLEEIYDRTEYRIPDLLRGQFKVSNGTNKGEYEQEIKSIRKQIYNILDKIMFISCFSEENNNMLMWSHYADYHKGICIEYSKEVLNNIKQGELVQVNYSKYINKINLTYRDTGDYIKECISRKDPCWRYEKEYRLVIRRNNFNKSGFNVFIGKPKCIYLGTKVNKSDKEVIVKFCKKRGVNLYQMKLKESEYGFKKPEEIIKFK